MSNQHNSIIGEEIKQHAEYQQVIYEILQIASAVTTCGKCEQKRAVGKLAQSNLFAKFQNSIFHPIWAL